MSRIVRTFSHVRPNQAIYFPRKRRLKPGRFFIDFHEYNRSLIEASLDPLVTIGADGKITDVNAATEQVTGWARQGLIGADFSIYFTEPERARAGYQQVFRDGTVQNYALEIRHRDGHITPVLYNASLFRNEQGEIAGVFAAARDITEQKRAGKALQELNQELEQKVLERTQALAESEQRFKAVAVNTPDHILVQDKGLRYTLVVNPQLGLTEQDMLGKTDDDFLLREEAEKLGKVKRQVIETGKAVHLETSLISTQGEERFFDGSYVPKRDDKGRIDGLIGYFRDVTERKQSEAELARLASFPELNPNPVLEISLSGRIEYINSTARKLFPDLTQKTVDHAYFSGWAEIVEKFQHDPTLVISRDIQVEGRHYQQSIYYVNKYARLRVYGMDITERRRMEEALLKSEERYRSLFNGTTEGFALHEIICDENSQPCDYRFLELNPAFERLTGLKRSELEGQLKSVVMPGDDPYSVEVVGKVALTGQPVHYENYSMALDRYYEVDSYCPAAGQFAVIFRNVTERKKAQERMFLQAHMLAAVGQGVVAVDLKGMITYWNRAAALLYGWQADEILGRGMAEVILPGDQAPRQRFEQIIAAMTSGENWSSEITVKRRDDSLFPALVTFAPIKDESGPMTGVIGVFTDLSERKLAEEALRQSEQRYRTLFETMTQGIVYLDTEGKVISANPAVLHILQLNLDELKGRMSIASIWQAFHEDGSPFPPEEHPVAVALRSGKPVQNVVMSYSHPKTGEITWIKMDAVPQFQPGENLPYLVYAVLDDITTRKHIEAERDRALDEAQRKAAELDAVFNSIADGVMLIGPSGEILSLNPAALRIFDFSPEQYKLSLNQRALITQPDKADGQPQSDFLAARALRGETVRNTIMGVTSPRSGRSTWISLSAAPLYAGKNAGAVLSFTDVTERMEMEEKLRQARDELEVRVQERTAELTSILTALRESEERFRQLAENIREVFVLFTPGELQPFYVSPAYAELVGRPPESLYEDPHSFLETIYAEDRPDVESLLNMINQGNFDRQYRMVRQDGSLGWVRARGFPVRNKQGELYRVAAIIEDVTSEVKAYQSLEQRVEERTRELTTLLSYSEKLASTLELKPLLRIMLDQLYSVVDYDGAAVLLLEGDELVVVEYEGPTPEAEILNIHFPKSVSPTLSRVIETRAPVIISNLQGDSEDARQFRQASLPQNRFLLGQARAWMGVPLVVKNQLVGVLRLSHTQPDHFTQRQAQLVTAIANQAAMAIENAHLYDQAQQLAALGERQRLARELHDSVSQALYGISLGTHTAIALTRRDPQKLDDVLKYILSLAEAALTEMRALIFELRQDSLETEGLVWALDRQAEALQARRGVSVRTNLCDEIKTSIEVKETIYRIAQEAMQNATKHASPSEIYLELSCSEHFVELVVMDDGSGFDPNQSFPGHLGLRSMNERATRLGGSLVIDSAPGKGTRVGVKLPV
jgi:PAS domain S-box-containing protein